MFPWRVNQNAKSQGGCASLMLSYLWTPVAGLRRTITAQDQVHIQGDININKLLTFGSNWRHFHGETSHKPSINVETTPKPELGRNFSKFQGDESRTGSPNCQHQYHWPMAQWGPKGLPKRRLEVMKDDKEAPCRSRKWKFSTKSWSHKSQIKVQRDYVKGTESISRCTDTTMDMPISK